MGEPQAQTLVAVTVDFTVKPRQQITADQSIILEATFARLLPTTAVPTPGDATAPASRPLIQDTFREALNSNLESQTSIANVLVGSTFHVSLLGLDGRSLLNRVFDIRPEPGARHAILWILEDGDIKALSPVQQPLESIRAFISRPATFVSFTSTLPASIFSTGQLQVAPLADTSESAWSSLGFGRVFTDVQQFETTCAFVTDMLPSRILGLDWSFSRVAVDGTFNAQFPRRTEGSWAAWTWFFSSKDLSFPILGVVDEALKEPLFRVRSVFLPTVQPSRVGQDGGAEGAEGTPTNLSATGPSSPGKSGLKIPMATSEAELADNPQIYTEDPGSFCEPFNNPARIVSERSFFSVVRTEQPVISAEASISLREPAQIDFDPPEEMLQGVNGGNDAVNPQTLMMMATRPNIDFSNLPSLAAETKASLINANVWRGKIRAGLDIIVDDFPGDLKERLMGLDRGRRDLDAAHPIQWDSESIRYQATTIARGHILEFRIRTRSNGYSLGTLAKTLTLAPRQTKRIQKVSWERSEFSSRDEDQASSNVVNDTTTRDSSYQDAVAANMSEWAKGSSRSSVTSAAAGVGAVLGPVAIGGGVAHSTATGESQQQGGRSTSGTEEQQWRDAIRRHGDDLRKSESMVVVEVSQREEVTGTVEVIQNKNYAHSLTVIYHNILRHLRVDTEFGGARECLFVPFAMKPFTMERAYRWRDTIRRVLRER